MTVPTCYANPDPIFQRAMRLVSDITNADNAAVTTTFAHNYETGDIVRLLVPREYGMFEISQKVGTVTVVDDTSFTIDIDSNNFTPFTTPSNPSPFVRTCAHVVPVGEVNSKLTSATQNVRSQ